MNKIIFILVLSIISTSCLKIQSKGRASKYYETFLLQGGGTQYFIKPIEFKSNRILFSTDFILKDNISDTSSVVCNFTFSSPTSYKPLKGLSFIVDNQELSVLSMDKIYIEKTKNYDYRYTTTLRYQDFKLVFSKPLQFIKIKDGEQEVKILPNASFVKKAKYVRENIIHIIDMQKND
jgi:hypothetical protein